MVEGGGARWSPTVAVACYANGVRKVFLFFCLDCNALESGRVVDVVVCCGMWCWARYMYQVRATSPRPAPPIRPASSLFADRRFSPFLDASWGRRWIRHRVIRVNGRERFHMTRGDPYWQRC